MSVSVENSGDTSKSELIDSNNIEINNNNNDNQDINNTKRTLETLEIDRCEFKHKLGDYLVSGTSLGQGSYAKVRLARHKLSNELYAIKIIRKPEQDQEKHYLRIKREVENLKRLRHENIIDLHDVFQTKRFICIVMEYAANGDLFEYVKSQNDQRLIEIEALRLFEQMVDAIDYCHKKLVVHRDLKPENVLLGGKGDEEYIVKIADFGFSRRFDPEGSLLSTCCGSIGYAAPELLLGEKYVGPAADIWSLGVILYTMIVGKGPFLIEEGMSKEVEERMIGGIIEDSPYLNNFLKNLIQKMLQPDPQQRIPLHEIHLLLIKRRMEIHNNHNIPLDNENNNTTTITNSSSNASSSKNNNITQKETGEISVIISHIEHNKNKSKTTSFASLQTEKKKKKRKKKKKSNKKPRKRSTSDTNKKYSSVSKHNTSKPKNNKNNNNLDVDENGKSLSKSF
eukprot:TRINITY_DN987_c0_g2_i2.p1 TRINITY_DN987_c0_g2~~TRINITY_DN987_c0_g2_i2.p1  ORF type:complete len:453 (-),score=123.73 TRINITY_DN987_c0_g2_i2:44-1402(-)